VATGPWTFAHAQERAGQVTAEPTGQLASDSNLLDWRAQVEEDRRRHADWVACVVAHRQNCVRAPVFDSMAALLNDDTLAHGDIVATPQGLRTFVGNSDTPHKLSDFK
jgi:hypothetical protein